VHVAPGLTHGPGTMYRIGVLLALLFLPAFADAATYVEQFASVAPNGVVSGLTCDGSTVFGHRTYGGVYPSGSLLDDNSENSNCSSFLNGGSVEDYWQDGTGNTTDGSYWFSWTQTGSAFSPDWNGTVYYFRAIREGGVWSSDISGSLATTTRIIRVVSPVDGYSASSTSVSVEFDVFSGVDAVPYTVMGVQIQDFTNGFEVNPAPYENNIIASGESTYTETITLPAKAFYNWRPYMRTASSTSFIFGEWRTFYLGPALQSSIPTGNPGFFPASTTIDSFPSATATDAYGGITSLLATKFPFSYIFDVRVVINELSQPVVSSYTWSVPIQIGTVGTSTLVIADFSAIAQKPLVNQVHTAIQLLMWFLFAMWCFKLLDRV